MKRYLLGALAAAVALSMTVGDAQAKRSDKRGGKKSSESRVSAPMGDLQWGMSKDEVLKWATDRVRESYRKKLSKVKGAIEEDRLRREMKERIATIHDSYTCFKGQNTGWDISYLKGEFTHRNGECMLVVKDSNSKNFYFFIKGRLWKWYKALDISVFAGKGFDEFAKTMQRKFGEAKEAKGELAGGETRHWLQWQDPETRLRAVDQTEFYGFYSLVFESKSTLERLSHLRRNQSQRKAKSHSLVESVTSGGSAVPDEQPNIVDRITGKNRASATAGSSSERGSSGGSRGSRGKGSDSSGSSGSTSTGGTGVLSDDDPLKGLDL